MNIGPYPKYKKAQLKWLEEIPSHWSERRAKHIFKEIDERSETGQEELLSVSHITGVTPRSEKNVTMFMAESHVGYKKCKPSDLVINTMWAWMAALGIVRQEGIVSPSYAVYRPRHPDTFIDHYYDYLLRTKPYSAEYFCRSTGIRPSRLRLYPLSFLDIPILNPPKEEQIKIINYLDELNLQFTHYIRKKEKMIELIKECKKSIIDNAIVKGINKLRYVGVPNNLYWLNKIPEDWNVMKIRHIAKLLLSNVDKNSEENEIPVSLCNYTDVYYNDYITNQINFMRATASQEEIKKFELKSGDVIITKDSETGEDIAVPAFVPNNLEGVLCGYHLALVRPNVGIDSEFIFRAFSAHSINHQVILNATGVTRYGISKTTINDVKIILPLVDEQRRIVDWINTQVRPLDYLLELTNKDLELFREYRQILISEVITGKIDVRNVVSGAD